MRGRVMLSPCVPRTFNRKRTSQSAIEQNAAQAVVVRVCGAECSSEYGNCERDIPLG